MQCLTNTNAITHIGDGKRMMEVSKEKKKYGRFLLEVFLGLPQCRLKNIFKSQNSTVKLKVGEKNIFK